MNKANPVDIFVKTVKAYANDASKQNYVEDKNGITININFKKENIYQPYSTHSLLNEEVFEFIEETYQLIDDNVKPLHLNILVDASTSNDEINNIKELIKFHYALKAKETRKEMKKMNTTSIILFAIGAMLLLLGILSNKLIEQELIKDILEIFAWVFLWESADIFIFRRNEKRMNLLKYLRLFHADIRDCN